MRALIALSFVLAAIAVTGGCDSPTSPRVPEWTATSILDGTHLHGLAFGAGVWVVVAQQGKLATSTDLQSWTERATHWTAADDILNVRYANGVFVATGTDRSGNGHCIAVSSDGISWTPGAVGFPVIRLGPLHYSHRLSLWFVSGRDEYGPVLLSSSDLVAWTPHDPGFGADPIISITEGHGMLMISGGSEKIGISAAGASWSVHQLRHSDENVNDIDKVRFFDGVFVAIMHPDASTVYRSVNGTSWTPVATGWPSREPSCTVWNCPDGPGGWVSIAQRNDGVIIATGVRGKMMLSRDLGASWVRLSSPVAANLNGIESDGRRFVVSGNYGTLLVSSQDAGP
ncbi:MAG TPA: hypothetical protein VK939_03345 [Longimicrobiales bacterium]|nr:hypothetical protein [Longimicrobiales bacterium]